MKVVSRVDMKINGNMKNVYGYYTTYTELLAPYSELNLQILFLYQILI
jgi:hypothetical protein